MNNKFMMRLTKYWDGLETGLNTIAGFIVLALMIIVLISVIGRTLQSPVKGMVEISQLLMPCAVFLAEPFTQRVGSHVRMEIFIQRQHGKIRAAIEIFIYILVISLISYVIVGSGNVALESLRIHDTIGGQLVSYITWPSKMTVPLGFSFLVVRILQQIIKTMKEAVKH